MLGMCVVHSTDKTDGRISSGKCCTALLKLSRVLGRGLNVIPPYNIDCRHNLLFLMQVRATERLIDNMTHEQQD